ncbi:PREDICTED: uncharacterized protein LOC109363004 [Lupinus angustifolius]|uniref:uncharacterized protein LOC109363004 n=1 Tax=Lupinus angustifolius TaxID=3871 RepID=UPI00092E8154|nr:PREDICTED: uncharacterized protein LOC109363004 [Lupinus angustifolius]
MESESKQIQQKLEVLDILKEAITIYVKNINFIIFTFLTSIPFFSVMVYFEFLFQQSLVETPEFIYPLFLPFSDRYYAYRSVLYSIHTDYLADKSFSNDYLPILVQLVFIYLVPLHVLELCSAVVTTDLASKLYSEESKMSLKQMFQESIDMSVMKGTFITSLYMLFLSTCILIAFPWTVSNLYGLCNALGGYIFFALICGVALAKLLMKYLEWSAIWNMSIVISVLDGIYGAGAFRVSYFLSSGNHNRGLVLMVVFFVIGLFFRVLCILFGCYKRGYGIFLQIGLLCVGNTLKWVSCMVYFYDCKERKLEKNADGEVGKDLESNS